MSVVRGWIGEVVVGLSMRLSLDRKVYRPFHNIIVPSKRGTAQIDHLLVSPFGIFVVETKNFSGHIFGSEHSQRWTQCFGRNKFTFQNPLRQNFGHIKALSSYLGLKNQYFHSVILFVGDCSIRTPVPDNVICGGGLSSFLGRHREVHFSDSEVARISAVLGALKRDRSLNRRAHLKSLRERFGV